MDITPGLARQLRREAFRKYYPAQQELIDRVADLPDLYFPWRNPTLANLYRSVIEHIRLFVERRFEKPIADIRLLDWGGGAGVVSCMLREAGAKPVLCDVDYGDAEFHRLLKVFRSRFDLDFTPLDHEYRLPFANGEFDAVLSVGVLEHVPDENASLDEIHRVLKPGGLFMCYFLPSFMSWTQRVAHLRGNYYHDRLYTRRGARALAKAHGFEMLDMWRRGLLPKAAINYPKFRWFEALDLFLVRYTPLRLLATNIEFVARRVETPRPRGRKETDEESDS